MSITEHPKLGQPRIANGTFVIFSFDPEAYASALDPADEIASAAASRIKRKKYLGLVEGVGPVDVPLLRQNLDIRVVGLAPPQKGEDDVYPTSPARCVPVYPASAHPQGREPLMPSAPLPWEGCYVHTLQLINAFVSRVHHDNPTNATITKDDLCRLARHVVDDQYAASDERRALEAASGSDDDASEYEDDEEIDSDSRYTADDSEDCDSWCDDSPLRAKPAVPAVPSMAYMEIWEDLTIASTLGEPKDVGADFDEVMEIGVEWQDRKKRNQRETGNTFTWAAHVAETFRPEIDGGKTEAAWDAEPRVPINYDYDDLAPGDAVDERTRRDGEGSSAAQASDPAATPLAAHLRARKKGAEPGMLPIDSEAVPTKESRHSDRRVRHLVGMMLCWIQHALRL